MNSNTWAMLGFLTGQKLRDMRTVDKKEPVAYSYNGMVLPDINTVWTDELKVTHPCALLKHRNVSSETDYLYLYLAANPAYVANYYDYDGSIDSRMWFPANTAYNVYQVNFVTNTITLQYEQQSGDTADSFNAPDNIFWANYDVINTDDNSVFLAASEPVPVYE